MSARLSIVGLILASQLLRGETPATPLPQVSGRIWRVMGGPEQAAAGTIYIFLVDGTLLETSCLETYRIARWTTDKDTPNTVRVFEDGQLAFTAKILELTTTKLRFQRRLVRSKESREITLAAVAGEFVCPDLPK